MTKPGTRRHLLPGAWALALLAGCSGTTPPRAHVTDARIRETAPDAAVVEFVIETDNPNDVELPIRDITYTLSLDGRQVFSGTREGLSTMSRGSVQSLTIPAVVPMGEGGVEPGIHSYTLRALLRYSLPTQLADVLFDARLSRPGVAISDEGEIDLREAR